jgi:hypothetical protein
MTNVKQRKEDCSAFLYPLKRAVSCAAISMTYEYKEYVVGVIGKAISLTDLDDYDGLPTAEDVAITRSRYTNDVIGVWDPDSSEADTARSVVAIAINGVLYRPIQHETAPLK